MVSIGLIGCGAVVHKNYARVLIGREAYSVQCVYDTDPGRAEETARLFGATVTAPEELVERVDATVITTPPSSHADLIVLAAKPGKTILCEKPFTTTHSAAIAASEAARAQGASLYVGQFRRTFPHLRLARQLVSLGVIGRVASFTASEGGRFDWDAVSGYTTADLAGGVLWDTGSHTLDMALYGAGLDEWDDPNVGVELVERDKPEPSHDFRADFTISHGDATVSARLSLSRRDALPSMIRIVGSEGEISFGVGLDDRVRLTRRHDSVVLTADSDFRNLMECFDVEVRSILLKDGDAAFAASTCVGQVKLLETLTAAGANS
jgi:myo-inositol 2-dehydrogenase/D-chiro-inositol 1-dehydrogenase